MHIGCRKDHHMRISCLSLLSRKNYTKIYLSNQGKNRQKAYYGYWFVHDHTPSLPKQFYDLVDPCFYIICIEHQEGQNLPVFSFFRCSFRSSPASHSACSLSVLTRSPGTWTGFPSSSRATITK